MILSASRRTDIPALYGAWMAARLREGEVVVRNPYHAGRAVRLLFSPDSVDCIVFWTKNPVPFERFLPGIEALGYRDFYFQYTITALEDLEPGLPSLDLRVEAFQRLSERLGPRRVDWRFDPVLLNGRYTARWAAERFAALCERLAGCTERCILSFADHYPHLGKQFQEAGKGEMEEAAALLVAVAKEYGLPLYTCAETLDLSAFGIRHAACMDRQKIEAIIGCSLRAKKDPGQRPACGCIESVDLGAYNTCVNGCAYCYATKSRAAALRNFQAHDPRSPMLAGWPEKGLVWTEKRPPSLKTEQTSFF